MKCEIKWGKPIMSEERIVKAYVNDHAVAKWQADRMEGKTSYIHSITQDENGNIQTDKQEMIFPCNIYYDKSTGEFFAAHMLRDENAGAE